MGSGPSTLELGWAGKAEADLSRYKVTRSTTSGGPYIKVNSPLVGSRIHRYEADDGSTTYYYAGNGGLIAYFVINKGTALVIPPAKEGVGAMGQHV